MFSIRFCLALFGFFFLHHHQSQAVPAVHNETMVEIAKMECSFLPDGYFTNPEQACSSLYFACVGGSPMPQWCQSPLVFDELTRACVWKSVLPACGQNLTSSSTASPKSNRTSKQPLSVVENDSIVQEATIFLCNDTAGTFADTSTRRKGCSQKFWVCAPKSTFGQLLQCPPGLFYDAEMNWCDIWERVQACSGKAHDAVSTTTHSPELTTPIPFDCSNKPEGNYPVPGLVCPHWFIQCANGIAFRGDCPGNLRYFAKTDRCLSPIAVPSCREPLVVVNPTPARPTTLDAATVQPRTSEATTISPNITSFNGSFQPIQNDQLINASQSEAASNSSISLAPIQLKPRRIFVGRFSDIQPAIDNTKSNASQLINSSQSDAIVANITAAESTNQLKPRRIFVGRFANIQDFNNATTNSLQSRLIQNDKNETSVAPNTTVISTPSAGLQQNTTTTIVQVQSPAQKPTESTDILKSGSSSTIFPVDHFPENRFQDDRRFMLPPFVRGFQEEH